MDHRWRQLYVRAEQAARLFFAEHFAEVCVRCAEAAERRQEPAFNCCRRTNFVPEIISDPLLAAVAEESLGGTLLPLAGPEAPSGCWALSAAGCRIPSGRPDVCTTYICEHLYRCAAAGLPAGMMCRVQDALDILPAIRHNARRRGADPAANAAQAATLEALLDRASQLLRENPEAFAERKAEVIFDMFPPVGTEPPKRRHGR